MPSTCQTQGRPNNHIVGRSEYQSIPCGYPPMIPIEKRDLPIAVVQPLSMKTCCSANLTPQSRSEFGIPMQSVGSIKMNPISELNELCQQEGWASPIYTVIDTKGPPHLKQFKYQVSIKCSNNPMKFFVTDSYSLTKQKAKAEVAEKAVKALKCFRN